MGKFDFTFLHLKSCAILVLSALFASHAIPGTPPSPTAKPPKAAQAAAADAFFKDGRVLNVRIEISQEGISKLRRAGWGGGDSQRPRVKATVRESDKIYTNVEVHLKG